MAAYCTEAQVKLAMNANEVIAYGDDGGDGSIDTNVSLFIRESASYLMYSIIKDSPTVATTWNPATYTEGDGTHMILELMAAPLAAYMFEQRQNGTSMDQNVEHPTISWCHDVRAGLADI